MAYEHPVHGVRCPLPFLRAARQIGLIDLDHVGVDMLDLFRQHIGDRHGQCRLVLVVVVQQHLGEHVRTGERELQRPRRQLSRRACKRPADRASPDRWRHQPRLADGCGIYDPAIA